MNSKNGYDSYWRMDDYRVTHKTALLKRAAKEGDKNMKSSLSKADIVARRHRRERGGIYYDSCSEKDLKQFCDQRKIQIPDCYLIDNDDGKKSFCNLLIEKLQDEDEQPEFHRFLELPPELRNRIYDMYVAEFGQVLKLPSKPPLARTCRLVRQEVLSVFYSTRTFEINLIPTRSGGLRESDITQLFLMHLTAENLSYISKLRIVVQTYQTHSWGKADKVQDFCTCIIERVADGQGYYCNVKSCNNAAAVARGYTAATRKAILHALREPLRSIKLVNGKTTFGSQDIHAMRAAIEIAYA